jgi:hypothetical protein
LIGQQHKTARISVDTPSHVPYDTPHKKQQKKALPNGKAFFAGGWYR